MPDEQETDEWGLLRSVATTYEGHVASRRAYGFVPLPYETWKSWKEYDDARLGPLYDQKQAS